MGQEEGQPAEWLEIAWPETPTDGSLAAALALCVKHLWEMPPEVLECLTTTLPADCPRALWSARYGDARRLYDATYDEARRDRRRQETGWESDARHYATLATLGALWLKTRGWREITRHWEDKRGTHSVLDYAPYLRGQAASAPHGVIYDVGRAVHASARMDGTQEQARAREEAFRAMVDARLRRLYPPHAPTSTTTAATSTTPSGATSSSITAPTA